jgi:hypothetical protein
MKHALLVLMLGVALAEAQEPTPPLERTSLWTADLPGGVYIVHLGAIRSISLHQYVVDGAIKVAEVNIATDTSAMARFYILEPAKPQSPNGIGDSVINLMEEKAREGMARTGAEKLLGDVVKSYPVATHAHTIEYRLSDRETLDKLFKHLERAWKTGNGGTFKS